MGGGYLQLFRLKGIAVRAHWSLPVLPLLLTGGQFLPGVWVGVLLVIFLHELGHALFVRAFHLSVLSIDLSGFGGQCNWVGHTTELRQSAIAWGGVLAQALVLIVALGVVLVFGYPQSLFLRELFSAFIESNAIIMALNLVPIPPLDGARAWPLFK